MSLHGRHLILGVSGGIAAYKAAELARLLVKAGAEVQVVMTAAASEFVGPLTFQALTGKPVRRQLFDPVHEAAMGHIALARWADMILIAPTTADLMARLAHGQADDLLTTLVLASKAPLAIAPAMNQQMWADSTTQANLAVLRARGVLVWGPAEGEQACGDIGPGRLLEPTDIAARVEAQFPQGQLEGVTVMVTAGPTREALDPVRFLGNRSSGRMGFALAEALVEQGATVTLIAGPVNLPTPAGVKRVDVESALEMHAAVMAEIAAQQIFVATAAVADYRPAEAAASKHKRDGQNWSVELVPNPDILAEVAALARPPFTLGFAAETDDLLANAAAKRLRKGVNLIAANQVGGATGGFDAPDNALTLLWDGGQTELPLTDKPRLARQLVSLLCEHFHAST